MDPELKKLLDEHMADCPHCTRDTVNADGNAELGSYCQAAMNIIVRYMFPGV